MLRVLFRILDVSHRILLLSLFWIVCGGFPFAMLVALESTILVAVAIRNRSIIVLQGSVTTVLEFGGALQAFSALWLNFRFYIENVILIALITAFLYSDIECARCISYEERRAFILDDSFGFTIYVITFLCIVMLTFSFYLILGDLHNNPDVCCWNIKDVYGASNGQMTHMKSDTNIGDVGRSRKTEGEGAGTVRGAEPQCGRRRRGW